MELNAANGKHTPRPGVEQGRGLAGRPIRKGSALSNYHHRNSYENGDKKKCMPGLQLHIRHTKDVNMKYHIELPIPRARIRISSVSNRNGFQPTLGDRNKTHTLPCEDRGPSGSTIWPLPSDPYQEVVESSHDFI